MSNILIIKHGSLGDIAQISGVLRDIRETHIDKKIFILTTTPYVELLSACPFIDGVLIDKRLPRWNLLYLLKLRNMVNKFNFSNVYDLQNSSRTLFYKRYLFNIADWSSARTTMMQKIKKTDIEQGSVLKRFELQLNNSKIVTKYTLKPDFSWACVNVNQIVNKFFGGKFILIFPFCSPKLSHKQWPYYNELIKIIREKHPEFEVIIAPSYNEMEPAKKIQAIVITNNNKPLNIMELAGLIKKSSYVISNDTGPAHMTAHLGKKGIALFGYHTTPQKVSIETVNFKTLSVHNLAHLLAETVYSEIKNKF